MLKTRVITALVLMAMLLPGIFWLSQTGWAVMVAVFVSLGAWEWGALMRLTQLQRRLLGGCFFVAALVFTLLLPEAIGATENFRVTGWMLLIHAISAIFWAAVVPFWLRRRDPLPAGLGGFLLGVLILFPTWLAVVQLRIAGPWFLLAILAVAWVADIAAYFAGRTFGRHKLAPSISPGKTWEGAVGAIVGVLIYGFVIRTEAEYAPVSGGLWALALLLITALSIIGDLFESMLKRQAGIKDSSNILPGHGGVLDRIDSLTSTLPLAALLWLISLGSV